MKKKSLSSYISVTVACMVACSILIISGALYFSLKRSLTLEFEERIKAESGEMSQIIQNRLGRAKNRLAELSLDNTIRVTLMLGASQQLQQHLDTVYGTEAGVRFFVATKEMDKIFSTAGPDVSREKIIKLLQAAPHTGGITNDRDYGFTLSCSIPVRRQKDQIGIAACIYYFKKDDSLLKFISRGKNNSLVLADKKNRWDLFTGYPVNVSGISNGNLKAGSPAYLEINNNPVLAVNRPEFPGMMYAASLESLNTAKRKVLTLLFIVSSGIILITVIISIFLSRKLTYPLNRLSKMALEIAGGEGSLDPDSIKSNVTEVERLMSSLDTMLSNLKETEELRRYQELFEAAADSVLIHELGGKIIDANTAASVQFGYAKNELMQRGLFGIIPEEHHHILNTLERDLSVSKNRKVFEVEIRSKDKRKVYAEFHSRKILFRQQEVVLSVVRDFTERRQAEEALQVSEERLARLKKMESLGLLAGGVAHDLNNVLSGIVSYPEVILMDLPKDSKLRKHIKIIQDAGYRAAAIVQDLLTVARGVATVRESLNINEVVREYLLSPEFKKLKQYHPEVAFKTELDSDLFNINGSDVHIRKVIMNLVSNSAEATEGNVLISTANGYVDKPIRGYDDINKGEYTILKVSDDGSGISSEDLERIFEPFYTKKVMGRSGTGLGLAVVWNIVQDHKGYIDVTSDRNGTVFELYFPTTRDEASVKSLPRPMEDYKGNGEAILVVDDVESQREITCSMLERLGYKSYAVSGGKEAIAYLKENDVELLLLDMIMDPDISGRETYERVLKIHPNQKAIIVSGFAETEEVREAQKLGAVQYIKKPFSLEKIGMAIKKELDK